jgi:Ca2+-binding EF-hand superfamily protein
MQVLGGGDDGNAFSEDMWREMIEEVDADGDGRITLDEFKLMMKEVTAAKAK